jgi:hypothetical protein
VGSGAGAIKQVPTTLTNLVTNGDFSDGTTGWSSINANISVVSGELNISVTALGGDARKTLSVGVGKKIYVACKMKTSSPDARLTVYDTVESYAYYAESGSYEYLSLIRTTTASNLIILLRDYSSPGNIVYVDNVLALDLTALGLEWATAEQIDSWLKDYDPVKKWFDGTKTLNTNRSAMKLTNLVSNGGFENDTDADGYADYFNNTSGTLRATPSIETDGIFRTKAQKVVVDNGYCTKSQTFTSVIGRKYYFSGWAKAVHFVAGTFYIGVAATPAFANQVENDGMWKRYSEVHTATATITYAGERHSANSTGWFEIDGFLVIDLTATFGSGNEPTAAQMDRLLDKLGGWFDGSTYVPISWCYDWLGYSQISLTNLKTNSDFSSGEANWSFHQLASHSTVGGVEQFVANGSDGLVYKIMTLTTGRKYYLQGKVKTTSALVCITAFGIQAFHSGSGNWETLSLIATAPSISEGIGFLDARTFDWDTVYCDEMICIDLTACYGAGNEPTKEYMDALIAQRGWFGSTIYQYPRNLNVRGIAPIRSDRLLPSAIDPRDNIVTDGLVAWWDARDFHNMPNTTYWPDRCGVNHAQASGFAYTASSGADGQGGVKFDGVNDYFIMTQAMDVRTFFADVYFSTAIDKTTTAKAIIRKSTAPGGDLNYGASTSLVADEVITLSAGNHRTCVQNITIPIGLHQIAWRDNGTSWDIFLDGIKQKVVASGTYEALSLPASEYIGRSSTIYLDQKIKRLLNYNRALTDAEIQQNYLASIS